MIVDIYLWVEAKCFVFTIMSASDNISGYKGGKKIPLANCKRKRIPTKINRGRFWWTKWINLLTLFKQTLKRSHCFLNGIPNEQSPFLFLIFEDVCSKVKIDGNLRKLWCGFGSKLSNLFCQFQHKVKTNQTQSSI